MGRLHVHVGLILGMALSVTGCGPEEIVSAPDDGLVGVGERACARPLSSGYWNDGTMRFIGGERHVCLCMTEAEYESKSRLDEINQMLLDECRKVSELYEMDWDDCDEDFAANNWIGPEGEGEWVTWPTDHVIYPPGANVDCKAQ